MKNNQTIEYYDKLLLNLLKKIEQILYHHAKEMKVPTIEQDIGILLFEATFYKYSKNDDYKKKSLFLLDKLINVFPDKELKPGFFEGFEGIFWVLQHLRKCAIIEDETVYLEDLLPYLLQSLEVDLRKNFFDTLHGSLNKLQFLIDLKKFDSDTTKQLLDTFVGNLYENKEEDEGSFFWFDEGIEGEDNVVNLGYAHGLPSLLVFLVRLKKKGYYNSKLDVLIDGIIKSISKFKFKVKSDSVYPPVVSVGERKEHLSSRLAYCYGDLGIAYALSYTSSSLSDVQLSKEAAKVINHVCHRTLGNSNILRYEDYFFFDPSFCHGIAGIVYILKLIDSWTNHNSLLNDRLDYWKKELAYNLEIQMNIEGDIFLPFDHQPFSGDIKYKFDAESFLTGYTGTGLVILSLLYRKYDWSAFLMLF